MENKTPRNCNNRSVTPGQPEFSTHTSEQPKRFQIWLGLKILAGLYLLAYSTFGFVMISRENIAFYKELFDAFLWIAMGGVAMFIIFKVGELIGKKSSLLANIVFLVLIHILLLAGLGIMLLVLHTQPQYTL